jgi:hypothetical protein
VASLSKDYYPGSVIDCLMQRVGETHVSYVSSGDSFKGKFVTLVSGSLDYMDSYVSVASCKHEGCVIGLLDYHYHGRLRNSRPSGLVVSNDPAGIRGTAFVIGGVTKYVALFCCLKKFKMF